MQARAARTRQALVDAAATEFDRHGYAGTSMVQVCRAAGITTGALTFHFGSKSELADAVQGRGCGTVRAAVDRVRTAPRPALDLVVELTVRLARLLEDDATVRSAARLTRERPGAYPGGWSACWLPTVRELAHRAQRMGQLRAGTPPAAVANLAAYLLAGTETATRAALEAARKPDAAEQLQQLWGIALRGICADRDT
ncbi:ScbR family autoregulator-binding transcription factor [Streptomyces sp. HK10]|uniref:ScbR family autoregulator-binding transcription factor n=1 Tax=Streptomyces sp. HK10 TaxID=3373255 RepID=UPI003749DE0A